ncbi:MAG: rhodanese-like protein [Proteobacteria bacterium]|nr:rhodanese-like protein [Pseudomonadota bacterium]
MKLFLTTLFFIQFLAAMPCQAEDVVLNGAKLQATIIDVRTPEEFAAGHIPGAVNIPVDRIESGIASIKGLGKDKQILLYCRSGRRSAIAKEILEKQGFRKIHDGGGMENFAKTLKVCSVQTC